MDASANEGLSLPDWDVVGVNPLKEMLCHRSAKDLSVEEYLRIYDGTYQRCIDPNLENKCILCDVQLSISTVVWFCSPE